MSSYIADVTVTINDPATQMVLTTEITVEFDSPDDPRAFLSRVALEHAAEDARTVERALWQ